MFGLSAAHLLILFIVLVVFFGAKRLPELGSSLGEGIRAFKKSLEGKDQENEPPKQITKDESSAPETPQEKAVSRSNDSNHA